MKLHHIKTLTFASLTLAIISACGDDPLPASSEPTAGTPTYAQTQDSPQDLEQGTVQSLIQAQTQAQGQTLAEASAESTTGPDMEPAILAAVQGASKIPYPIYPNGEKYRVGGENGLKIVAFETTDSFDTVDNFYQDAGQSSGMSRLAAMSDYVRYSNSPEDKDPWATFRPGIVIHRFNDDEEREAVGADGNARTNIIMSY